MPTYDFLCPQCALRFEVKRSFSDQSVVLCTRCGTEAKRLFSMPQVFIKGSPKEVERRPWWQKPGMDQAMADAKGDMEQHFQGQP